MAKLTTFGRMTIITIIVGILGGIVYYTGLNKTAAQAMQKRTEAGNNAQDTDGSQNTEKTAE